MRRVWWMLTAVLGLCAGCGNETVRVAASRYIDPAAPAGPSVPVCFRPPAANLGLADRDWYQETVSLCATAAQQHGIQVLAAGTSECLLAKMEWSSSPVGASSDCMPGFYGWSCDAKDTYVKVLKLTLVDGRTGQPVVETKSAMQSGIKGFRRNTAYALCSAAFRGHPSPMKNEQVEIELLDED